MFGWGWWRETGGGWRGSPCLKWAWRPGPEARGGSIKYLLWSFEMRIVESRRCTGSAGFWGFSVEVVNPKPPNPQAPKPPKPYKVP